MTDCKKIAELIFSDVDKSTEYYEELYPARDLPEGARVTRFAPSPTGYLHFGGLYAGFASKLTAETTNGVFMLRIEDTDKKRGPGLCRRPPADRRCRGAGTRSSEDRPQRWFSEIPGTSALLPAGRKRGNPRNSCSPLWMRGVLSNCRPPAHGRRFLSSRSLFAPRYP